MIAPLDRRLFALVLRERIPLRVLVGLFGTIYAAVHTACARDRPLPDALRAGGWARKPDAPLPLWCVRLCSVRRSPSASRSRQGCGTAPPRRSTPSGSGHDVHQLRQHVATSRTVAHTAVLAIAPAAAVWSLDQRRQAGATPLPHSDYGWPLRLMTVLTVITYVLAGLAKVRHGGGDWVSGDVLRNLIAHDNLRKIVLGDVHSPIGGWLVSHRWLFPPMALASVIVELGAPVVFLGGRVRRAWILTAWLFHLGVLALMAISFFYPLTGVAYASMLHPEVVMQRVGGRLRRRAPTDALLATYGRGDAG
jgi:hypothetical protein